MLEKPILNDEEEVQALQENGQVAMSISGKPIRDFPFLPRYIATNAPAWLLEYWFRTDSRLKYNDILMRMAIPLEKWPSMVSYINTVRNRFRNMLGLSSWASHQGAIKLAEVELVDRWTYEQIYLNTTMVIEYGTQAGGVSTVPQYLRSKMLLSGVPRYYNVGTFCGNGESFRPSDRMERTMDLLIQLKRKAQQLGLATWQLVPPGNDIPMSWAVVDKPRMFSRVVTQKFDNNLVLPDWRTMSRMSKETWQPIFGNGAQEDNGVTGDEQPEDV